MVAPRPRGERTRSIRVTIFGLLVVPIVSLVALWGFAAQSTAGDAFEKRNLDAINKRYGAAITPLLQQVGLERQQTVVYVAGNGRVPRSAMDAQRPRTDAAIAAFVKATRTSSFRDILNAPMRARLAVLVDKSQRLATIRRSVDVNSISKLSAFDAYNEVMDAHFHLVDQMSIVKDAAVTRQAQCLTGLSHAQELVGREAVLVAGALTAGGRMTVEEHSAFTRLVMQQRLLIDDALDDFDAAPAAAFRRLQESSAHAAFASLEDRVVQARPTAQLRVSPTMWGSAVQQYSAGLDRAVTQARPMLAGHSKQLGTDLLVRLAVVGGLGLIAVLLSSFLLIRFGNRIVRELRGLRTAAHEVADRRLPAVVSQLRRGDEVDVDSAAPPICMGRSTAEVAGVASAFSSVQRTAVEAAVGQAELRAAVGRVFRNLARRNQSLLHRQLAMLDVLERKASSPEELDDLFRLDHLTTRMRRHAEGLIILSGATPGRGWRQPVAVLDVLRGAIGEIEDYARVEVVGTAREAIVGGAVADMIHLIAELVENAVNFSPPNTPVEVDAGPVGNGFVVEISDRGLGMSAEKLEQVNRQLAEPPDFGLADGDQLGLFVVATLAHKHGIKVSLVPNAYGGLKTIVLLPHTMIASPECPNGEKLGEISGELPVVRAAQAAAAATPAAERPAAERPAADWGAPEWPPPAPSNGNGNGNGNGTAPAAAPPPWPAGRPSTPPGGIPQVPATADRPATADAPGQRAPEQHEPQPATHAGMPRRVRRASMAPQLRDSAPATISATTTTATGERPVLGGRSPEQARSVMASMQSGWRRGRAAEPDEGTGTGMSAENDD
ncbi:sensor histidine kinase [Actinomadura parmotrematis]|uniref:histidine kinase n=1 Tax=Actinomadura parmotrematis TaxID=2864039 RepID=A0ABS7G118_9ACTN|nr:nitrate- and nitrite sensing domain-containing protein [Actinomadura parmotrematis]MBW8486403.1 nitrate- and nitrite sensing domain-containing protein [Actinomadura parmotrematis]